MSTHADQWLVDNLIRGGKPRLPTPSAIKLVKSQPPELQARILKACVKMLPTLRERWSDHDAFQTGEQLYNLATALYRSELGLDASDLSELLHNSKHGCGHGCDVHHPLDLAMSHLSAHDASHEVLSAVAAYAEGLKGVGSIQAQTVKRRASILLLLDRTGTLGRRPKDAWSRRFTSKLNDMQPPERLAWQQLVVAFKLSDRVELPNTWRKIAGKSTSNLGEDRILARLDQWWPSPESVCKLDTGGSHLLKHFVWLLAAVDEQSVNKPKCNQLVCALADVPFNPVQPAAKVVCAAANYLVKLPRPIAWEPLQKLVTKAPSRENWIRELVEQYASK